MVLLRSLPYRFLQKQKYKCFIKGVRLGSAVYTQTSLILIRIFFFIDIFKQNFIIFSAEDTRAGYDLT